MNTAGLDFAHTGAFEGFYEEANRGNAPMDYGKAGLYFEENKKKLDQQQSIVHDREYAQAAPQTYVPGKPSPMHFGVPLSDGYDPGVYAVSYALFGGGASFKPIPITFKPVFRRRQRGDCLSEWSNAFVTRVDPCECANSEETYTPYEVARYRDHLGNVKTTLDFGS